MEQKNQRNSRKRLNSLILLVAFTAIMLIVSTYAWFSAQQNVSITNLTGIVNVVEGLQISLDAVNWSDTLDLSTLDIIDNAYTGHTNFKPTELLPVSTDGRAGASAKELPMYRGTNTEKVKLSSILPVDTTLTGADDATTNPETYPGYIAFDVFLQNSGEGTENEVLQLNSDSKVTVLEDGGNPSVGLQNTVRVAFAQFSGVGEISDTGTTLTDKTNATASYISDVAIWEPNANAHVANIVGNNNKLILDEVDSTKWELTNDGTYDKFTATQAVPTYGLTASSVVANKNSIANIYDWKATPTNTTDKGKIAMQYTVQTNTLADESATNPVMDLKSSKDGTTNFAIPANKIVKLRVYVWLEGQDVDCTSYASHGGGIDVNIGLIKGETENIGNRPVTP